VTESDFFANVREAAATLRADGHAGLASELVEAVEAGSTGGEIMMRLRFVLRRACEDDALEAHRDRLAALLKQVESVLA
jgi:hypothetical protein